MEKIKEDNSVEKFITPWSSTPDDNNIIIIEKFLTTDSKNENFDFDHTGIPMN